MKPKEDNKVLALVHKLGICLFIMMFAFCIDWSTKILAQEYVNDSPNHWNQTDKQWSFDLMFHTLEEMGRNKEFYHRTLIAMSFLVFCFVLFTDYAFYVIAVGVGGGLGNVVELLMFDYATDFIRYSDMVIFNVADIFIVISILLTVITLFIEIVIESVKCYKGKKSES